MAYATHKNLEDRYGTEEVLLVSDRDGDGASDVDVVVEAIADADDLIDSYLSQRYDLPLSTVPGILTRVSGDIAMYMMASTADALTEERRTRYEDAIKWLKDVVAGKASLGLADEPATTPLNVAVSSSNPVRIFTRATMWGV